MKEIAKKNRAEIQSEIEKETMEMAKKKVNEKVNPSKDTNLLSKKKKNLARLKTALSMNLINK